MAARGLTKEGIGIVPRELVDEERLGETNAVEEPEGRDMERGRRQEEGVTEEEGPPAEEEELAGAEPHSESTTRAQRTECFAGRQHALRSRGALTWCDTCGSYSVQRAGKRLKGVCLGANTRHRLTRLARLRQGKHPITGAPLE